ncbi:site-specific integrase [Vibrio parahaemolyticus]|uniref:tyrosine-type recombinase/integrase n=1 Tax=Vibrio parahaemolyticus TaxID=670 RepID=UPI0022B56459|nr:site-specific integrase [Vibrio parahaemolyticus]MCZ5880134.1 site-specific integrase [Vibrio parahaemolyticus]MCZ6371572.1 site-specific integrase [Vibrio parahaemolyticus]
MPLSDAKLRAMLGKTHSDSRPRKVADREGLCVLWWPTGKLSWIYRYRFANRQKDMTIGRYTSSKESMTLKEARDKAALCRSWLDDGLDPKVEIKLKHEKNQNQKSVKDALEYWLDNYAANNRQNVEKHRSQFKRHIYPTLGSVPVERCTTFQWLTCFDIIRDGSVSKNRRAAPVAAGYIFQNVKQALKYCKVRRYAVSHALDDLNISDVGKKQGKGERFLTDKELSDVVNWLREGKVPNYYRNLISLVLIFGSRSQELRLSTIGEWDLESKLWTVPKEHSKSGKKIIRPIPDRMVPFITVLLTSTQKHGTSLLLGELKSPETVSMYGRGIWKKLNHVEKWTLHDFRRTFSTKLADSGTAPHIVELLLGHELGGVMAIYNRSLYLDDKLVALNNWIDILEIFDGA